MNFWWRSSRDLFRRTLVVWDPTNRFVNSYLAWLLHNANIFVNWNKYLVTRWKKLYTCSRSIGTKVFWSLFNFSWIFSKLSNLLDFLALMTLLMLQLCELWINFDRTFSDSSPRKLIQTRGWLQYSVAKCFLLPNNQLYRTPIYELAF